MLAASTGMLLGAGEVYLALSMLAGHAADAARDGAWPEPVASAADAAAGHARPAVPAAAIARPPARYRMMIHSLYVLPLQHAAACPLHGG